MKYSKFKNYFSHIKLGIFIVLMLFIMPSKVSAITEGTTKNFSYTGGVQVYEIEATGYYQLETWGAQGGSANGYRGGFGGYSTGVVFLRKGEKVYVVVGGAGANASYGGGRKSTGGYNGGGYGYQVSGNLLASGGGGATHMATKTGLLSSLSSSKSNILIVSGGGSGAYGYSSKWWNGNNGGGYYGGYSNNGSMQGTQSSGYAFGQASDTASVIEYSGSNHSGGGGGYYGGHGVWGEEGAGGGSGYIASSRLISYGSVTKSMYCYGCKTSTSANIYTVSTTNYNSSAISKYSKSGSGYAKIKLLKLANTNAKLKTLDIPGATFDKPFNSDTYTYNISINADDYDIDIDATAISSLTTIAGTGNYKLKAGVTTINITGTAESGDTAIYTLNVHRPASSYKYLTDITVNGLSVENFNPKLLEYTVNLPYNYDEIDLKAFYGHIGQTIDGVGKIKIPSGNSTKKIEVMSEDKSATTIYTINFVREHSSKLKTLTIDGNVIEPKFTPDITEYIVNIMNSTLSLNVNTTTFDEEANVTLNGFGYIRASTNATITVTEPNSEPTIYTVRIVKGGTSVPEVYNYPYEGKIQTFTAPVTGFYKLETWGAQGGTAGSKRGGFGGYSTGVVKLFKDETIYIAVGGTGGNASYGRGRRSTGGYNGGGMAYQVDGHLLAGGGGGATHMARKTGLLSTLSSSKNSVLIVSGGGAGGYGYSSKWWDGNSGGGYYGGYSYNSSMPGTQNSGYAFGQASDTNSVIEYNGSNHSGGGGGYYGGHGVWGEQGAGGGSGYIANSDLISYKENTKVMYCFSCRTSENASTYTESTNNHSSSPTSYYAKEGNGHARITLLAQPSENNFLSIITTDKGTLSPAFDMTKTDYNVTLDSEDDTIVIGARLEDDTATLTGTGTFDVPAGTTTFPITVTAEDGSIRIYTVNVTREASKNAIPSNITISGLVPALCSINEKYCKLDNEFDPDIHDYSIIVPGRIKNLEFTVNKSHKYQKVVGEGIVKLQGGMNSFTIEIESEDGSTTERYTYNIERDMTGNANIEQLEVTNPKVDINFDPDISDYYFSIPNEYTNVELKVTLEDENATYKVLGNENFEIGLNIVQIEVTAQNGEVKTYMLNIYREQNGNTFLSELSVSHESEIFALTPTFNKVISTYTVNVGNEINEVEINARAEHNLTTISGLGKKALNVGTNNFNITSTAENGDVQIYTISVIRAKNTDATLQTLDVLEKTLTPEFKSDVFEYSTSVNPGITSLNINAVPTKTTSKVQITGNSGFKVGVDNVVKIVVTAEAGNTNTYLIHVNRIPNTNTYLKYLNTDEYDMNAIFDKETEEYNITVENDISQIEIFAEPEDNLSKVSGKGKYSLTTGNNDINIMVLAESGLSKTYQVHVFRKYNNNANLLTLNTSSEKPLIPEFKKDETNYMFEVENDEKKLTVLGTPEAKTSKVKGNGEYDLKVGDNVITITAIAEDGTTKDYVITVKRKQSSNANASMIIAKESVLDPAFDKNKTSYELKVVEDVTSLTLLVTLEDETATYEVIGNSDFVLGEHNKVIVKVTAQDKTVKEYELNVLRQEKGTTSNRLNFLKTDKGTLSPTFDKDTTYYEVEVPYNETDITLTGELEDKNATVKGLGTHKLSVGQNVLAVEVISVENVTRYYQVVVTRNKNNEARLSNLQVIGSNLEPNFNKDTYSYRLTTTETSLLINAIPIDNNATYEIIGNENLTLGSNEVIIRVTAEDGVTISDYVLNVEKEKSNNNNLKSLEVEDHTFTPEFNKTTTIYYMDVDRDVNKLLINAIPEDENATVTGDGNVTLTLGVNYLQVTVTSETGKEKIYTLIVTRNASSNNYLESLTVSSGTLSPEFIKTTNNYNVTVPYEVEEITLEGTKEDENATVTGLDKYILEVGQNELTIAVTAEDGKVNIYKVIVTREEIVSSQLEDLKIKNYELDQPFSKDVYDYNVTVDNEVTTLLLDIIPIDKGATWTIEGNENFEVGMNQVKIIVKDRLQKDTSTYILNVNRQSYSNTYLAYIYTNKGELTPPFEKTNLTYTIEVENDVEEIQIDAEPEITTNTLTGTGVHNLNTGDNKIPLKVTTPTGITRTYYVNIKRKLKNNNNLTSLEVRANGIIKTLTPAFESNTLEYRTAVDVGTKNVQINATAEEGATITGIGNKSLSVGENNFEITVTAENGETKIYKVIVDRPASSNNNLIDIIPSVGSLSPSFSYEKNEYSLHLDSSASLLSFAVETEDLAATVTGVEPMVIPDGESTREIIVTAENGDKKVYRITVHKDRTDEARLKSLTVQGYTLNETFDKDKFSYTLNVPNSKNVILSSEVEALPLDNNASVTKTSSLLLTSVATNIYSITVTAKDGFTKNTYTISIEREKGSDSSLAKLEFAYGEFSPLFSPTNKEYNLLIPRNITTINKSDVTAVPQDPDATVIIPETFNREGNDTYEIIVESPDKSSSTTYRVHLGLLKGNDATLKSLTTNEGRFTPSFTPSTESYTVDVRDDLEEITIDAEANDAPYATVSGLGTFNLPNETNNFNVTVTAEDGTVKIYTLTIVKSITTAKHLKDLYLSGDCTKDTCPLNPEFKEGTKEYKVTVENEIENINIEAIKYHSSQIVRIYNAITDELIDPTNIHLNKGANKFRIEVENGVGDITSCELNITRELSSNNYLSFLRFKDPEVELEFDKNKEEYFVTIPGNYDNVTLEYEPEVNTSTVITQGTKYLVPGNNDVKVIVTAENATSRTYIIHVEKEKGYNNYLQSLTISSGTIYPLVPKFSKLINSYIATVPYTVSKIKIDAVPEDITTTVTGIGEMDLKVGNNSFAITSTAKTGEVLIYNVSIARQKSTRLHLKQLDINNATRVEDFNRDKFSYTVEADADVSKLDMTIVPEDSSVNYRVVGNSTLKTGPNTVMIILESADKTITTTYKLTVNKKASSDNFLKSLKVGNKELINEENIADNYFDVTLPCETDTVLVEGIPRSNTSSVIRGNGTYSLGYGDNSIILTVVSEDGQTRDYEVNIKREYDNSLFMISTDRGEITPKFNKDTLYYYLDVDRDVSDINVLAVANSSLTKVTGNGYYELEVGKNLIYITVSSKDRTFRTYTLEVRRNQSNNNYIKSFYANDAYVKEQFEREKLDYTLEVPNNIKKLDWVVELEDEHATYEIVGNEDFKQGDNEVKIVVTAENGDERTYNFNVFVQDEALYSNRLLDLTVENQTLLPMFDPDTTSYTVTVPYSTESVKISGVLESVDAKVIGFGSHDIIPGRNEIPVVVLSKDKKSRVYTVIVYRIKSNDPRLKLVEFEGATFTPIFDKDVDNYNLNISDGSLALNEKVEPLVKGTTYKITGNKNLTVGNNVITITATAEDGVTTKDYIFNVTKEKSSNNYLESLTSNIGAITPAFDKTNTGPYVINVSSSVNSIVLNGKAESSKATVNNLGVHYLQKGRNQIPITVTSETGTERTYTVIVNKDLSDENALTFLGVNEGALSPTFSEDELSYNVEVKNDITEIIVTAHAKDVGATITGDGTHSLEIGNNVIPVTVTAEDGSVKTYTINVTREDLISSKMLNLKVKEGQLSPAFDKNITDYAIKIPFEVNSLTLEVTLESNRASYRVEGNENFVVGSNTVTIVVSDRNGNETTYTLDVIKRPDVNSYLKEINISEGVLSPEFNKENSNYEVDVSYYTESIDVEGIVEDKSSTVEGNGTYSLNVGDNYIDLNVTSIEGYVRTYTLNVKRSGSYNKKLLSLSVSPGEMDKTFDPDIFAYNVDVPIDTNEIEISATADDDATIAGTGVKTLSVGTNRFNVVVTGRNGYSNIYEIIVEKKASSNNNVENIIPSSGTLSPEYANTIDTYEVEVDEDIALIDFDVILENTSATVSGNYNNYLNYGDNNITITVTAEDGTEKEIHINVIRDKKISEIKLDSSLLMEVGDVETLTPTILPDDAIDKELVWESADESIVTVSDGVVSAISLGDTIITVSSRKNPEVKAMVNVSVLNLKITSDIYDVRRGVLNISDENAIQNMIIGAEIEEPLNIFLSKLKNRESLIKFYDINNQLIENIEEVTVATGQIVKLEYNGKVYDEAYIVVRGDDFFDGVIDINDLTLLVDQVLGKEKFSIDTTTFKATDVDETDEIDINDTTKLLEFILGKLKKLN